MSKIIKNFEQNKLRMKRAYGAKWGHYVVLHEISHLICGYSCCREHAEFEAHGGAKVLAALLDIELPLDELLMNEYAGCSQHKACGRLCKNQKIKNVKKEKKLND